MNQDTHSPLPPQKKKSKGPIIALIIGLSIFFIICALVAVAAFSSFLSKTDVSKNIGITNPGDNTELISKLEAYDGVEGVKIRCSHPVPWQYQNCEVGIRVTSTITESQLKAVGEQALPSVANDELGSTPKGIVFKWGEETDASSIESSAFGNINTLNTVVAEFYSELQKASVPAVQ